MYRTTHPDIKLPTQQRLNEKLPALPIGSKNVPLRLHPKLSAPLQLSAMITQQQGMELLLCLIRYANT